MDTEEVLEMMEDAIGKGLVKVPREYKLSYEKVIP